MATLFKDRVSMVYYVNQKVCKKRMCKFESKGGCIGVIISDWSFYLCKSPFSQQNINYNQYRNNRVINNETQNNNSAYNQKVYEEQVNQAVKKAYYDAYIRDLKNRGYKIKYKKTFKEYLKDLIALVLTLLIFLIILQIPFVKRYFSNLYEENIVLKNIVDIFKKIIFKN